MTRKTLFAVALFAACGGTTARPPAKSVAKTPQIEAAPTTFASPEEAMAWVVEVLNNGGKLTETEIRARFDESFLGAVPPAQIAEMFQGMAGQFGKTSVVEQKKEGETLVVILDTRAGKLRSMIALTKSEPKQIAGLLFKPTEGPVPASYEEALTWLKEAGQESQFFFGEIKTGRCVPRHEHNARAVMPIGSSFKLWVLLALAQKLGQSGASWEQPLAITKANQTLPGGVLQNEPEGTTLPLRHFAANMIAISDNTATDHLIDFVGRDEVERALRSTRHSAVKRNLPFLKARELFALKLSATPEELARFRHAKLVGKREMLVELSQREPKLADAESWDKPRHLDLEWFASARDVCSVYASLAKAGNFDENSEVLKILSINPGAEFDKDSFSYVGYKGGSEPGVGHMAWLLKRDSRWFVLVVAAKDDQRAIDYQRLNGIAIGLGRLFAKD